MCCASHRYALATKDLLVPYTSVHNKVHKVMTHFRYPIPSAKLKKFTPLKPKISNSTRWSSSTDMLKRYIEIRDFLPKVKIDTVTKLLLSPAEDGMVDKACLCFSELGTITKALQSENTTLSDVRAYFDGFIEIYPEILERLGRGADIVLRPYFKSGIVKLQQGHPHELLATGCCKTQNNSFKQF